MPEYTKGGEADKGREVLGQVVGYIEAARRWKDVSTFVNKCPFKIDAGWTWDWMENRRLAEGIAGMDGVQETGLESEVQHLGISVHHGRR